MKQYIGLLVIVVLLAMIGGFGQYITGAGTPHEFTVNGVTWVTSPIPDEGLLGEGAEIKGVHKTLYDDGYSFKGYDYGDYSVDRQLTKICTDLPDDFSSGTVRASYVAKSGGAGFGAYGDAIFVGGPYDDRCRYDDSTCTIRGDVELTIVKDNALSYAVVDNYGATKTYAAVEPLCFEIHSGFEGSDLKEHVQQFHILSVDFGLEPVEEEPEVVIEYRVFNDAQGWWNRFIEWLTEVVGL